ncbi:MAG: sigma-54-dependent Fis family transcriptional regulator [bacterium]|nr:sigma-54-dependent Fis family transcriptional regulator [bacterium]
MPRILVVDDQYGGARDDGRNRRREDFCFVAGLRDVTGDVPAETVEDPVAEAIFCRGQRRENGTLTNDRDGTLETIRQGWQKVPRWALLFLDLHFKTGPVGTDGEPAGENRDRDPTGYFGLTLLEALWRDPEFEDLPVVLLSSMPRADVEHRFAAGDRSVAEFIDKDTLNRSRMRQALREHGLVADDRIAGRSVTLLKCLREARGRAKVGNDTILLLGETGTGKELLARYVHDQSPRADQRYVTVYTQGVPEALVEDRLFGHERGAFTGATSAVSGAAETADGGTLFIDEFGDVPASVQPKLLRLLDKNTRETQRLGGRKTKKLDLQIVLATHRQQLLSANDFRQDLLFRAKADDPVVLPPLRDRHEDIPLLTEYFVRKYEAQFRDTIGAEAREISGDALEMLCAHPWPGNVRQLERVIESAVYRWPKLRTLSAAHLAMPDAAPRARPPSPPGTVGAAAVPSSLALRDLASALEDACFDPVDASAWAGLAPELRRGFALAYGNLFRAALQATRKPTPSNPEGEIKIHPAVKLAMGDSKITASKAADTIKRVMAVDASARIQLEEDPVLKEAYEIAVRLRPKGGRK